MNKFEQVSSLSLQLSLEHAQGAGTRAGGSLYGEVWRGRRLGGGCTMRPRGWGGPMYGVFQCIMGNGHMGRPPT